MSNLQNTIKAIVESKDSVDDGLSNADPFNANEISIFPPQPIKKESKTCCACLSEDHKSLKSLGGDTTETLKKIIPDQLWSEINHNTLSICLKCLRKVKLIQNFIKTCTKSLETFKAIERSENGFDFEQIVVKVEPLAEEYYDKSNIFEQGASDDTKPHSKVAQSYSEFHDMDGDNSDNDQTFEDHFNNDDDSEDNTIKEENTQQEFTCSLCNKKFANQKRLKMHLALKNHQEIRKCNRCDEEFKNDSDWKQHQRMHYRGEWPCEQCGRILATKGSLEKHVNDIHKMTGKNPYICDICDAKLLNMNRLIYHMTKEHIKPTFLCPHCGRSFYSKSYLKKHVDVVHLKVKKAMVDKRPCPHCGDLKMNLATHIKEVHDAPKWKCRLCVLVLKSKAMLQKHMYTHSNERPFNCDIEGCSFGSYHLRTIKNHYLEAHQLELTQAESNKRCRRNKVDEELLRQDWQKELF